MEAFNEMEKPANSKLTIGNTENNTCQTGPDQSSSLPNILFEQYPVKILLGWDKWQMADLEV